MHSLRPFVIQPSWCCWVERGSFLTTFYLVPPFFSPHYMFVCLSQSCERRISGMPTQNIHLDELIGFWYWYPSNTLRKFLGAKVYLMMMNQLDLGGWRSNVKLNAFQVHRTPVNMISHWGNFFRFGTDIHLNARINWLELVVKGQGDLSNNVKP